jgi:O-antigen polymerase
MLLAIGNAASSSRTGLLQWASVLTLIAQKPWLGWGWDELRGAHVMTDYPGARST